MADVGQRTLGNLWDWTSNIGRSPTEYSDEQNPIHADMTREALSIERMNNERAARRAGQMLGNMQPQGVTRRPPTHSYGSENMYNYTPGVRPNTAQHQQMLNEQLKGMNISKPEQQTLNAGTDYRHPVTGNIINQGAAGINSTAAGTAAILGTSEAARDAIDMRENSDSRLSFNARPENKGLVPTSLGSSIGYREPTAPTAEAKASPHGYNQWTGQAMSNWKDAYRRPDTRDIISGNFTSSPKRDMRTQYHTRIPEQQTKALGTNVQDPLGRQVASDNNQTSSTQVANNGNVNNPKITNKPNANGSNGFF